MSFIRLGSSSGQKKYCNEPPRSSQHPASSETRLAPLTREPEIQAVLREAFHQLRDHFARADE
jgi:hypothetical protein